MNQSVCFKKGISIFLICCLFICSLTACSSRLNGTYTNKEGLVEQSFTFVDDSKVFVSAFGVNVEGEYQIEDNKIIITYSLLNVSYDLEKSFIKNGNSIFIDGTEFVKNDN